jgi:hypothetical protein
MAAFDNFRVSDLGKFLYTFSRFSFLWKFLHSCTFKNNSGKFDEYLINDSPEIHEKSSNRTLFLMYTSNLHFLVLEFF